MKITKLKIENIGIVQDVEINIDKPEIVFYGEIKQGKSTLLNAVRWAFGGSFPEDIIRHGQSQAYVHLEGIESDGSPWVIRREWYVAKDQTTKARDIVYTRKGIPVKKPVPEIKKHLNPFLLDQDYLRKMTTLERGRYLVELFGVKTDDEDATITAAEQLASQLRVKVKMYGSLDLTPVKHVDIAQLRAERDKLLEQHNAIVVEAQAEIDRATLLHKQACAEADKSNVEIRRSNSEIDRVEAGCVALKETIDSLERQLRESQEKYAKGVEWLAAHKRQIELPIPAAPDLTRYRTVISSRVNTSREDEAIAQAAAQNVRADNYEIAKSRAEEKAADEMMILEQDRIAREGRTAKVAKLAALGKETGIPTLVFTEGGFEFDGTDSSMLSDSQIMRLSDALSGKYPEGFGLSMIDRGESLGKSVLTLWEEALARDATVLVTVVGDKPAVVPEQVGAYVVENGGVKK